MTLWGHAKRAHKKWISARQAKYAGNQYAEKAEAGNCLLIN
jgi:hypothetical protein